MAKSKRVPRRGPVTHDAATRERISEATRAGLATAREAGAVLGNPDLEAAQRAGHDRQREDADAFAARMLPIIRRIQKAGASQAGVAAELNRRGIRTARGGKWYQTTVWGLLKRVETEG